MITITVTGLRCPRCYTRRVRRAHLNGHLVACDDCGCLSSVAAFDTGERVEADTGKWWKGPEGRKAVRA